MTSFLTRGPEVHYRLVRIANVTTVKVALEVRSLVKQSFVIKMRSVVLKVPNSLAVPQADFQSLGLQLDESIQKVSLCREGNVLSIGH